jgi:hypothetical protein
MSMHFEVSRPRLLVNVPVVANSERLRKLYLQKITLIDVSSLLERAAPAPQFDRGQKLNPRSGLD